jgi:hypothetical protein
MKKLSRCLQTGKVYFATKGEAIEVIKMPKKRGRNGRKRKKRETRTYECEYCGGWHLTSQDYHHK